MGLASSGSGGRVPPTTAHDDGARCRLSTRRQGRRVTTRVRLLLLNSCCRDSKLACSMFGGSCSESCCCGGRGCRERCSDRARRQCAGPLCTPHFSWAWLCRAVPRRRARTKGGRCTASNSERRDADAPLCRGDACQNDACAFCKSRRHRAGRRGREKRDVSWSRRCRHCDSC